MVERAKLAEPPTDVDLRRLKNRLADAIKKVRKLEPAREMHEEEAEDEEEIEVPFLLRAFDKLASFEYDGGELS